MFNKNAELKGYLAVFVTGILFGTIGIFVAEMARAGSSAELTSFLRMSLGTFIMIALTIFKYGVKSLFIDLKTLFVCALIGVICDGIYNIFNSLSVVANGVAVASVLMYTAPVFTSLGARILFKEKFTSRKIFALILNIIGCILVVTGGKFSLENISLYGLLCGIGAGFCYGMSAIIGKIASSRANAFVINTWAYFFAAIFILIFTRPDFEILNLKILEIGFLFALIPTAIAYILYYYGLANIKETSKIPIITSLEPVTAVLIGVMLYHENLGFINLAGIAAVIISIII